jgi:hypothetical protein
MLAVWVMRLFEGCVGSLTADPRRFASVLQFSAHAHLAATPKNAHADHGNGTGASIFCRELIVFHECLQDTPCPAQPCSEL